MTDYSYWQKKHQELLIKNLQQWNEKLFLQYDINYNNFLEISKLIKSAKNKKLNFSSLNNFSDNLYRYAWKTSLELRVDHLNYIIYGDRYKFQKEKIIQKIEKLSKEYNHINLSQIDNLLMQRIFINQLFEVNDMDAMNQFLQAIFFYRNRKYIPSIRILRDIRPKTKFLSIEIQFLQVANNINIGKENNSRVIMSEITNTVMNNIFLSEYSSRIYFFMNYLQTKNYVLGNNSSLNQHFINFDSKRNKDFANLNRKLMKYYDLIS